MKKLLIIPVLFLFMSINAQTFLEAYENTRVFEPWDDVEDPATYLNGSAIQTKWSKIWGISYQFDDILLEKDGIKGSVYLFDGWDNSAVMVMKNKKYIFSNINFHINRDEFMSQIEGDSTFVYNLSNIDKIYVNNKEFKSIYNISENKNKVYEVIYGSRNLSILKGYSLKFIGSSPNPMLLRAKNEIKRVKKYYVQNRGKIYSISLRKSKILALLDSDKRDELKKYVKSSKLSYRNEKDLGKILSYYSTL